LFWPHQLDTDTPTPTPDGQIQSMGATAIETYLIDRVIPAVEGRNRRDAAHRVIAGFSMGGFGAANIALRHSDLFSAVASIAGYFHIDDPDGVFAKNPKVEEPSPSTAAEARRAESLFGATGGPYLTPVASLQLPVHENSRCTSTKGPRLGTYALRVETVSASGLRVPDPVEL
jgi:S-formylglutathione hydrolase FrmB